MRAQTLFRRAVQCRPLTRSTDPKRQNEKGKDERVRRGKSGDEGGGYQRITGQTVRSGVVNQQLLVGRTQVKVRNAAHRRETEKKEWEQTGLNASSECTRLVSSNSKYCLSLVPNDPPQPRASQRCAQTQSREGEEAGSSRGKKGRRYRRAVRRGNRSRVWRVSPADRSVGCTYPL